MPPDINGYPYDDTANTVPPVDGQIGGYGYKGSDNTGDPCMCPDDGTKPVVDLGEGA